MPRFRAVLLLAACVALPSGSSVVVAQDAGYLLGAPRGSVSLRVGAAQPDASSRVFSFVSEYLTLGKRSFASPSFAGEAGVMVGNRIEAQFGVGVSGRTVGSNYRDFVDNDDREIEQTTSFRRVPVTLGLRYYLVPPGRNLGRYAWVPNRFSPYVAAGAGGVYYNFRQSGDFVDFETLDVFNSEVSSSSWALTTYGAAGVNYSLSARTSLAAEARYDRANAQMSDTFIGFDRIDLSGASMTFGVHLRF